MPVADSHTDNVKPARATPRTLLAQVISSRGNDPALLSPVDCVHWVAESLAAASLDFDEGHDLSISDDEVDLTELASVTLGEDPATPRLQV